MTAIDRSSLTTSLAKDVLTRLGLQVKRRRNTLAGMRRILLVDGGVDLLIDVGAHAGEYGAAVRREGYSGQIISFEPVEDHFRRLSVAAGADSAWDCHHCGIGAESGTLTINVSGNDGFSSSILEMEETHERALAESRYYRSEKIEVVTLDHTVKEGSDIYLKVDAQGYEREVLTGASATLQRCLGVELELSVVPLYTGQPLMGETIEVMRAARFALTHLEPEFIDPASGELLQVNGLFQPAR
jgi:FkbM family methyltransferase